MKKSGLFKTAAAFAAIMLIATALVAVGQNDAKKKKGTGRMGRVPRGAFVESLKNWNKYYQGPVWEMAFAALEKVTADTPDGTTQLQGDDIRVMVSSYDTKDPKDGVIEAHQEFIDIQMVIKGNESFRWWPMAGLTPTKPYDAAKDIMFFDNKAETLAEYNAKPGVFAVFMPGDAHATQTFAPGTTAPQADRKVVVKIRASLLSRP